MIVYTNYKHTPGYMVNYLYIFFISEINYSQLCLSDLVPFNQRRQIAKVIIKLPKRKAIIKFG